jgi:hypothetical protein
MDKQDERVRFMAKLPPDLHRWLKITAAERGVDMNDLMVTALDHQRSGIARSRDELRLAVQELWNRLSPGEPSPVKRIASQLRVPAVDVALVVYPSAEFGLWDDSQEPELL